MRSSILLGGIALVFSSACSTGGVDPDAADSSMNGGTSGSGGSVSGGASAGGAGTGGTHTASGGSNGGSATTGGAGGNVSSGGTAGASSSGGTNSSGGSSSTGGTVSFGMGCADVEPPDQEPGTWANVITPEDFGGKYLSSSSVDPARPCDIYIYGDEQGCWRSSDYGSTWNKVSTGISGHGAWYATIDKNPERDPSTPPDLYVAAGYAENGIWKSTDGGVNWVDVWNNNVFSEDGNTNIYSDVGRDVFAIHQLDPADKEHLLVDLHSYWGSGGNNGVFESTDGGTSWRVHTADFDFAPHSQILFPVTPTVWAVSIGDGTLQRTTDGSQSWNLASGYVGKGAGMSTTRAGATFYAASDAGTGDLYKTTDDGATWSEVSGLPSDKVARIVASATHLYATTNYDQDVPGLYSAPIEDDATWTEMSRPESMTKGGHDMDITFDGTHYILIMPNHSGGLWRYVEP